MEAKVFGHLLTDDKMNDLWELHCLWSMTKKCLSWQLFQKKELPSVATPTSNDWSKTGMWLKMFNKMVSIGWVGQVSCLGIRERSSITFSPPILVQKKGYQLFQKPFLMPVSNPSLKIQNPLKRKCPRNPRGWWEDDRKLNTEEHDAKLIQWYNF